MKYLQLYRREDNQWVGQFKAVQDINKYAEKENLDLTEYEIRLEENRYPS